jgi:hypothetical protein
VNGDGNLDLWIPPRGILYNNISSFVSAPSTKTAGLSNSADLTGGLMADISGDGVLDLWYSNVSNPQTGLFYDSAGVLIPATDPGDLATGNGAGNTFYGVSVADIDHSNYLTGAWARFSQAVQGASAGDGVVYKPGHGVAMFKRGPAGFTNVGGGATALNLAIDSTLSFESWQVHFFDADNDGYPDLLMPSFRHGYSRVNIKVDSIAARKGCVLFLNDGTGKFYVPGTADIGRTLYSVDSIVAGVNYAVTTADTGIVVDDTVRHFNAIGSTWGELNNDGNIDVVLIGFSQDNWNSNGGFVFVVILYGKGDGTFTYKWNGANYVNHGLPDGNGVRAWDVGDYNNDGIPDLVGIPNFATPRMFRGNGNGTFTEVSAQIYMAGSGGRAGGFVDYDNNGFLDVYARTGGNSSIQKNNGNSNHWIAFTPVGTGNNKSAIGARFTLYAQGGSLTQTRVIRAEGNANGGATPRANFGLGINESIDSVVVRWPDGTAQTFIGLAVDRYWTVIQGSTIPTMPSLASPADAATGVAQTGTLTWNPAAGAVDYQVQVSMDATFEDAALLAVDATVSDTSLAFSLGAATQYYWRVAGINGGFMGDFTAANDFTTAGVAATVVPTKISPIGNATNQAASLMLKVARTSDASRYHWQASTLPSFATLYANETTADTTVTIQFVGGQTFYWKVQGVNDLGVSAYSGVDTFTVMAPPVRTTLRTPANNAQNVKTDSVRFEWAPVSNAASYNLQVSTVNSTSTYTTSDTTYKVFNLARLTNYTWKVEAINAGGTSFYTGNFNFTTVIAAPAVPLQGSPASAAIGVDPVGTTFTWGLVENATKYGLQLATDNAFATIVVDTSVALDSTLTLTTTLGEITDYYWRINAQNIGGSSAYSTARLFTTGTINSVENVAEVPKEFALFQNYPNPFNPSTKIRYDIAKASHVRMIVYDVLGREVSTLVDGIQDARSYVIDWTPNGLGTGVYFLRIVAKSQDGSGEFVSSKKILFVK